MLSTLMVEIESFLSYSGDSSSSGDRRQPSVVDRSVDDEQASKNAGDRVGRYVVREWLGTGGMGVVHEAWDPELDRRVAIKLIRPRRKISPALLRRRLLREAQAMARLRHPNVVAVYDVGESDGQLFVAMEYVDGVSLRKWLHSKPRSVSDILEVFHAAGQGLAAAHAEGLIHRDFKPDNVLVAKDGKVLVLDFGLASWASSPASGSGDSSDGLAPAELSPEWLNGSEDLDETSLTKTGAVLGTPNYMAPEQQRGHLVDARGDQFAFCVALWQALTGDLPYGQDTTRSLARARVGRLGKLQRKGVPARVERALRRGLAWRPEDRWPSMHGLLDAIASPKRARWWWAAVPVVLLGGFGVWWLDEDEGAATFKSCDEQAERASEAWNESVSASLGEALAGRSELARRSWPYLRGELDQWIAGWAEVDVELCERYGIVVAPGLREQQLLCMDRALEQFELVVDLLESATVEEIEHSFELLSRLPEPAECREAMLTNEQPGVDPLEYARLQHAVDQLPLEFELGRHAQIDASSVELFAATNKPGFEPLHMIVVEARSSVLVEQDRREEAIDVAFSGLTAAERNGSAKLRLHAFTNLATVHINTQDLKGAERFLEQAKTIAAEPNADRVLRRDLAVSEAWILGVSGRLDEGVLAFDRALALTDPQTEKFQRLQITIARAHLLGYLGKAKEALVQLTEAEREFMTLVGPDHPEVLDLRLARANILMRLDDWKEAREELLDASSALEKLRGQPTTLTLSSRATAAWLLDRLGDCQGALAEFEPIIPLAREQMAYPGADLGAVLTRRSGLCNDRAPGSVDFAREALALYRAAVGDEHVMVASARTQLASTLFEAGELEAARGEVETALAIYTAIHPIGAEFVDKTKALELLIRHGLGEPGALDGLDELLPKLGKEKKLSARLAALR